MIHSVSADRPSFKPINFKRGLNVVLATRTQESGKKDSRNGLGKSALLDILHFCLGGDRYGVLDSAALDGWEFTVKLDIGDQTYSVSRALTPGSKIFVAGDCSNWPIQPMPTLDGYRFDIRQWRLALGHLMFGTDTDHHNEYGPSFRSLISYFVRRDKPGGYGESFRHTSRQLQWDCQVNASYLLGLDWTIISQKQILRDRENALKQLKKRTAAATIGDTLGSVGDLNAVKVRLTDEISAEAEQIAKFKVHKVYRRLEADANKLTGELHELANQNVGDQRMLDLYRSSIEEEHDTDPAQIAKIYAEAGLLFPDAVIRRLEDVQQFHKNIVRNRRDFLRTEMSRLKTAVLQRNQIIENIDHKKSGIMEILKTHGALDEFNRIQQNHQTKVAALEDVVNRLKMLKDIDNEQDSIKAESVTLQRRLKSDLEERESQRTDAIRAFNSYSEKLYSKPGILSIEPYASGYKFDVKIERSRSSGYEKMKILCYDLTLAKLWASRQTSPGFLIHDSTIFADVDERQVALALRLTATESQKYGYQYICTMNSDSIPQQDIGPDFDFDSNVVVEFTDARDDGGLLGIRF